MFRLSSATTTIFALTILLCCNYSCANYKAHFKDNPDQQKLDGDIEYSSFFVGDLGYAPERGATTLAAISKEMNANSSPQSLLLLGDITGPEGFQINDSESRLQLDNFLSILAKTKGKIYFTPGENELGRRGYFSRLDNLEDYFKKHCSKKIKVLPKKGCSGPKDDEIHNGIGLIGLNSAWYLSNWHNEAEVSEGCDFNNRHDFLLAAADEIKGYRDKVKIVMMHHPLQSSGNRGGKYSLTQHLFPLVDVLPGAYIPLPVVGNIARTLQGVGGGRQDLTSLRYKDFIKQLKARTEDENNIIFLSAHEHNLLYANHNNHHVITAGSGSQRAPAAGGKRADFVQGTIGFGRLDFLTNGAVYLRFYTVSMASEVAMIYSRKIIENRFLPAEPDLPPIIDKSINTPTVFSPVYGDFKDGRSGFYNQIFGEHYRDLYNVEVEVPVLYLDTIFGGLLPYRRGGGQSTQSLHARASNGQLYQLRSIRKNPAQLLPDILERSFAAELARDQFTAVHPYAPLTLPKLQEPLGLLGPKPSIYFVPKQKDLGSFNSSYGGEMYYLEQRPDEDWSGTDMFANSKNIISNSDMREEMADDWKHRANQKAFITARLFDFWIGDWDRHRDQWRWAEFDQPNGFKTYLPVARDRDQVYSNFDGVLLKLAAIMIPEARKLKKFGYQMGKARWLSLNGKWNDRFFLNELTKADFEAAAIELMEKMTDEVIDEAMEAFPKEVKTYSIEQEDIGGKLKKRRQQMLDFAREFYDYLAKVVTITATNKDDVFILKADAEGNLLVQLFDADKEGNADEKYYERTFQYPTTKEIRLYGLDGDDLFRLEGSNRTKIRLRIIGGTDDDDVDAQGAIKARVYDDKSGMKLAGQLNKLKDRRSNRHPILNQYQFEEYKADYTVPFPSFGYNVDDGLFFGLGITVRRHGFRPDPFASNQFISTSISTNGTKKFDYLATFNNTFGQRKDCLLEISLRSPEYVVNFFGLGNETASPDRDNLAFNQTRQERRLFQPTLRFRGRSSRTSLNISPYYQSFKVDKDHANENNSLINQPNIVPQRIFNRQSFAGLKAAFHLNNLAIPAVPDNGIKLALNIERTFNLNEIKRNYYRLGGNFTYYHFFGRQVIGLASRIGYERIDGEFEFYQAAQLGGRTNFRAVRSERFLGNAVAYHNTDIRIRGLGFGKKSASATAGILLGFDYGRVWLDDETDSKTWHYAYGGGLWMAPANAVVIRATYFSSKVGSRLNIGTGFGF